MTEHTKSPWNASRLLIVALLVIIVVLGLALVVQAIGKAGQPSEAGQVNVLENSKEDCVTCHRNSTPGIVEQYGHSTMAGANVSCKDCHEVKADYPGATEHEGTYVLSSPTAAMCAKCHGQEVAQFEHSRHGIPAYVAVFGSEGLTPDLMNAWRRTPPCF